ncbi:MAG: NADPH-dependent assimilatory sulfite reductase hemoprotein subunit [Pseudobacteriovorax sp.]|nr:NADPH-dependent assimilatory sulfite reductase hemoprotein subunit [Pseudobacteriovorax sp.]
MSTETLSKAELLKLNSQELRGTIIEELQNDKPRFTKDADLLLKFHGMYQQKDRDRRPKEEKHLGPKPFSLMVRGRIPGGRLTKDQWLIWDTLADKYSISGLRLTTRQSVQIHGVLKHQIKKAIQDINETLQSTTGACGDVVRNVTQSVNPWGNKTLSAIDPYADLISTHFEVASNAYQEIFLDGVQQLNIPDPIYKDRYLPRKFKIGITLAGNNSIDIYTHDLGFAATANDTGDIDGFFVFVGGGMGQSHTDESTFPRLADQIGWIAKDQLIPVAEAVVTTQRDYGDRDNRAHARLKYTIANRGVEWFKQEVESRSGVTLQDKELPKWDTPEHLGWIEQADGNLAFGVHLLSGRIINSDRFETKTALRKVIESYASSVQITPEQDLILEGIDPQYKQTIEGIFDSYGVNPLVPNKTLQRAVTCVALPTCVKALAESERVGETIFGRIAELVDEAGKQSLAPTIRITGCPNGCARPYAAEIGLVGQLPNKYALYIGGNAEGTRLNTLVKEKQSFEDIVEFLTTQFGEWKIRGESNERFGDFFHRISSQESESSHES